MRNFVHRLLHRVFTILCFALVLALVYSFIGRGYLPVAWHQYLDPTSFGIYAVFVLWVAVWVYYRHFRYRDLTMERVDDMDGFEFERFCAYLLRRNGYRHVSVTQESGDQGVDVIATKNKTKYGVQCKRYNGFVGNHAVQEVWSGHQYYNLDAAIVLSNSQFSDSAQELAKELGVELIGRDGLRKMMRHLPS